MPVPSEISAHPLVLAFQAAAGPRDVRFTSFLADFELEKEADAWALAHILRAVMEEPEASLPTWARLLAGRAGDLEFFPKKTAAMMLRTCFVKMQGSGGCGKWRRS